MLTNRQIIKTFKKMLKKAYKYNEVPVAAFVEYNGKIISKAYNKRNHTHKTIDHAEIIAITKANKKLKNWRLNKCTLWITMEPCDMCKNVIKESRINNIYYLTNRDINKKQYSKCKFELVVANNELINYANNYKKIIKRFWQNKR